MTPPDQTESEEKDPKAKKEASGEDSAKDEAATEKVEEHAKPEEPEIPQPNPDEVVPVLEALLFATTAPMNMNRLQKMTGNLDEDEITGALNELRERYEKPNSGIMLMEVAGGYQLATRASVADWVLALHKHRRKNPISPAVMETLAIVAYKQPIVKAEIESIRGVDSGGVMRSLLDAGLVEVVGTKDVIGRPSLYGTSDTFLKTFGLKSLEELPSIVELKEILEKPMKGSEKEQEELEQPSAEEESSEEQAAGDSASEESLQNADSEETEEVISDLSEEEAIEEKADDDSGDEDSEEDKETSEKQ